MSWLMKLYETYDHCAVNIGRRDFRTTKNGEMSIAPLLPVAHTTMNANIEVLIDGEGYFLEARVLDKSERMTVIPCTEGSASRSGSAPVHHPLFDKLQYLAGDYVTFGGDKGRKFHLAYLRDLEKWCNSAHANPRVKAICEYLKTGELIGDLVYEGVLVAGESGKLKTRKEVRAEKSESEPQIFKTITGEQWEATVRINVETPGKTEAPVWEDPQVYQDYIDYYLQTAQEKDLCYGTGKWLPASDLHPKKLVPFEANAKLISANDSSGFTYRGRFTEPSQAAVLSYEVSQKAHNALKWLIDRQGYILDNYCFLAWELSGKMLPSLQDSSLDLVSLFERHGEERIDLTKLEFARRLKLAMAGYKCDLSNASQVVVLGLTAATPGRLSITFYRELPGDQFIDRVEEWHSTCSWYHVYGMDSDGNHHSFVGAPSPKDIAEATYGRHCSDKLKAVTIQQLLHCIADGSAVSRGLVNSLIRRASNLIALKEDWERDKLLSIACSIVHRNEWERKKLGKLQREVYNMSLDTKSGDRSYLYGRLLAVADYIEHLAYDRWNERDTNAMRYQSAFSQRPFKTWKLIEESLAPYISKIRGKYPGGGSYYQELLDQIMDGFESIDDFESDEPLDGSYLLGFHCQRKELRDRTGENRQKYEAANAVKQEK